jgi:hypothetical protein
MPMLVYQEVVVEKVAFGFEEELRSQELGRLLGERRENLVVVTLCVLGVAGWVEYQ